MLLLPTWFHHVGLCGSSWAETKKRRREQKIGGPMRKRPVGPTACRRARAHWALRQQWDTNMAVSIARLPAVNLQTLALTFLTAVIFHRSVADLSVGSPPAPEEPPHRRFEYKYSFKGPHLSQSDGSIPFWIHTGSKFGSSCAHFILNSKRNGSGFSSFSFSRVRHCA